MADNVKKSFAIQLSIDANEAKQQMGKIKGDFKNLFKSLNEESNKMTYFKELVDYLQLIDSELSRLRNTYGNLKVDNIYGGLGQQLRDELSKSFDLNDTNLSQFGAIRNKLQLAIDKKDVTELGKVKQEISELLNLFGMKNTTKNVFGSIEEQAKELNTILDSVVQSFDIVRDNVAAGFGLISYDSLSAKLEELLDANNKWQEAMKANNDDADEWDERVSALSEYIKSLDKVGNKSKEIDIIINNMTDKIISKDEALEKISNILSIRKSFSQNIDGSSSGNRGPLKSYYQLLEIIDKINAASSGTSNFNDEQVQKIIGDLKELYATTDQFERVDKILQQLINRKIDDGSALASLKKLFGIELPQNIKLASQRYDEFMYKIKQRDNKMFKDETEASAYLNELTVQQSVLQELYNQGRLSEVQLTKAQQVFDKFKGKTEVLLNAGKVRKELDELNNEATVTSDKGRLSEIIKQRDLLIQKARDEKLLSEHILSRQQAITEEIKKRAGLTESNSDTGTGGTGAGSSSGMTIDTSALQTTISQEADKIVTALGQTLKVEVIQNKDKTNEQTEFDKQNLQQKNTNSMIDEKTVAFNKEKTTVDTVISEEIQQLEDLRVKLESVKDAVDAKTAAFENESIVVDATVDAEVAKLNELSDKLVEVKSKMDLTSDTDALTEEQIPQLEAIEQPVSSPELNDLEVYNNELDEAFKNTNEYKECFSSLVKEINNGAITAEKAIKRLGDAYLDWTLNQMGELPEHESDLLNIDADRKNPLIANAFKGMNLKEFIKRSVNKDAEKQLEEEFYKLAQTFVNEDADAMNLQIENIADFIVENSKKFRERKEENIYEDAFKALKMVYTDDDVAAMGPQLFERAKSILGRKLQKATDKNKHLDRIDQAIHILAHNYPSLFEDPNGNESDYNKLDQLLDTFDTWKREGTRKTRDVTLDENDVQGIIDYIYGEMLVPMMANIDEQKAAVGSRNETNQISIEGFSDTNKNTNESSQSDEIAQLENLRKKINAVKKAVEEKTEAFKAEGSTVDAVVDGEVMALQGLWEALQIVEKQIDGIVSGLSYINSQDVQIPNDSNVNNEDNEQSDADKPQHIGDQADNVVKDYALESTLQATNGILTEISGKLNQEQDFSSLINPLKNVVAELQNAANGIVQHQKAQNDSITKAKAKASQDKFKADLDTQLDAFDKYEKSLEGAGYLTTELSNKIEDLKNKLVNLDSADGLRGWQKEFKELAHEIDIAKAKWTGTKNADKTGYKKQADDAIKGLGFSPTDSDLNDKQREIKLAYDAVIAAVKEYEENVKSGNKAEIDGIQAAVKALKDKTDAYRIANDIANVSTKNFGATVVRREERRHSKLTGYVASYADSPEFAKQFVEYNAKYKEFTDLQKEMANAKFVTNEQIASFERLRDEVTESGKELTKLINASEKLKNNAWDHDDLGPDFEDSSKGKKNALTEYIDNLEDFEVESIEFKDNFNKCIAIVKDGDGAFKKITATVDVFGRRIVSNIDDAGDAVSNLGKFIDLVKVKSKQIFAYLISMVGIEELFQQVRQGITYVKEIDDALTELKKVTNETDKSYDRFLQKMSSTASVVGSTVAELTKSAADWARLGYSMEDAGKLAATTTKLLNVSEFENIDDATSALVSSLQAFLEDGQDIGKRAEEIVDILNNIGKYIA